MTDLEAQRQILRELSNEWTHMAIQGTPHGHHVYVNGCFRCDLSREELDD